jgi:hypothetical protein
MCMLCELLRWGKDANCVCDVPLFFVRVEVTSCGLCNMSSACVGEAHLSGRGQLGTGWACLEAVPCVQLLMGLGHSCTDLGQETGLRRYSARLFCLGN